MEAISKVLDHKRIRETLSGSNREVKSVDCWRCWGTTTRFRDVDTGEYLRDLTVRNAGQRVVAESCLCERRKTNRALLSLIPPAFGKPKLSRLQPRPDLHQSQASAIEFVKNNPNDSYLLIGKNFTGKSHLAWALFRFALCARRPAIALPVRELLDEYRRYDLSMRDGDLWTPRIRAIDLRKQGKRWFIFLDEFEKVRPSEFSSEQLFSLLDAAASFNHQIVITSNFEVDQLRDHWGRVDPVWGNSIMTRLQSCREINFF